MSNYYLCQKGYVYMSAIKHGWFCQQYIMEEGKKYLTWPRGQFTTKLVAMQDCIIQCI